MVIKKYFCYDGSCHQKSRWPTVGRTGSNACQILESIRTEGKNQQASLRDARNPLDLSGGGRQGIIQHLVIVSYRLYMITSLERWPSG